MLIESKRGRKVRSQKKWDTRAALPLLRFHAQRVKWGRMYTLHTLRLWRRNNVHTYVWSLFNESRSEFKEQKKKKRVIKELCVFVPFVFLPRYLEVSVVVRITGMCVRWGGWIPPLCSFSWSSNIHKDGLLLVPRKLCGGLVAFARQLNDSPLR